MLINTTFYFFTTYGHLNSFLKIFMAKLFLEMGDLYSKNYKLTYKNLSLLNPFSIFIFLKVF